MEAFILGTYLSIIWREAWVIRAQKTRFLRSFNFICYHFPDPQTPQLLQIVSKNKPNLPQSTPYFFFHHFPKSISKSFSHMTPWLRGPYEVLIL